LGISRLLIIRLGAFFFRRKKGGKRKEERRFLRNLLSSFLFPTFFQKQSLPVPFPVLFPFYSFFSPPFLLDVRKKKKEEKRTGGFFPVPNLIIWLGKGGIFDFGTGTGKGKKEGGKERHTEPEAPSPRSLLRRLRLGLDKS
jgi:hypothetical protein